MLVQRVSFVRARRALSIGFRREASPRRTPLQDRDQPLNWTGLEDLRPMLETFASRRCHDIIEAEDVVQETLLRAARRRPTLHSPDRLRGWVMRIAANVHRDWLRREGRYIRTESQEEWLHTLEDRDPALGDRSFAADCVAEGDHELGEAMRYLPEALTHLRPEDREVLERFYVGRESCKEIAARCSITRSLAKVRVFRARQKLGKLLRRRMTLGAFFPRTEALAS